MKPTHLKKIEAEEKEHKDPFENFDHWRNPKLRERELPEPNHNEVMHEISHLAPKVRKKVEHHLTTIAHAHSQILHNLDQVEHQHEEIAKLHQTSHSRNHLSNIVRHAVGRPPKAHQMPASIHRKIAKHHAQIATHHDQIAFHEKTIIHHNTLMDKLITHHIAKHEHSQQLKQHIRKALGIHSSCDAYDSEYVPPVVEESDIHGSYITACVNVGVRLGEVITEDMIIAGTKRTPKILHENDESDKLQVNDEEEE